MRAFLTFVTLYGVNFTIWGCAGISRLTAEEVKCFDRREVWPVLAAPAVAVASLLAFGYFLEAVQWYGLFSTGKSASLPETSVSITHILAWISLFAGTGAYLYGYLIKTRFYAIPSVLIGSVFGLGAVFHLQADRVIGAIDNSIAPLIIFMISALSGWLGLTLAHRKYLPDRLNQASLYESPKGIKMEEVAVLVPAHNEEKTIRHCLRALDKVISLKQVFVGSDGSTDDTVKTAKRYKCHVAQIHPNGGKARTIKYLLDKFSICERYKAVLILDADSEIDRQYLKTALPLFDDPCISAVAGHAVPKWRDHIKPTWSMFFIAYRVRLYMLTQAVLRYGQTWKHSNVSFIIPGFASMYRCSALRDIDITAKGLIIEDFNMTFELHHKKLGKIAYKPAAHCACEDPHSLKDYIKQVRRWYLGFWQTVGLHGFWPSAFWLSLGVYIVEMMLQSMIFVLLPLLLAGFIWTMGEAIPIWFPHLGGIELTLGDFIVGVLVADYMLTAIVSILVKKPVLMVYGLGFVFLRWIDAWLFLLTLPLSYFVQSDGKWVSPSRA